MKSYREMADSVISEINDRRNKRRMTVKRVSYAVVCLCAVIVTSVSVLLVGMNRGKNTVGETKVYPTLECPSTADETTPSIDEPIINWGDGVVGGGMLQNESFSSNDRRALEEFYSSKGEDALFAWVVSVYGTGRWRYDTPESIQEDIDLSNRFNEDVERIEKRIMADMGVGKIGAAARKYNDVEFLELRETYMEIRLDILAGQMKQLYDDSKEYTKIIEDCGLVFEYDAEDRKYVPYLAAFDGIGVVVGTWEQMKNAFEESGNKLRFALASEYAAEWTVDGMATYYDVILREGSKLTVGAEEAYKKAAGGKVKVEIALEYFKEVDNSREALIARTLEKMGITQAELDNSNDSELIQEYIELKRRLLHDSDYTYEVVGRLLSKSEIIEVREWSKSVIAEIDLARALEIAENKEIAYIEVFEKEYTPIQEYMNTSIYKVELD